MPATDVRSSPQPADDAGADDDAFARCGETFQPSWQPTLWCSCDRPAGHGGEHFGMPRGGRWAAVMRVG